MDLGGAHPRAEAERRHDRQFVGGVVAFDIVGGVRLRVPQFLRGSQRFGVAATADRLDALLPERLGGCSSARHARENVVGGAVDDRPDRRDLVRQEVSAQRRNEGDAPAYARFEHDIQPTGVRVGEQLRSGLRHQLFVRRDNVLASGQRPANKRPRRLFSADHLDDDVDCGVVQHGIHVVCEGARGQFDGARLRKIAHGRTPDDEGGANLAREVFPPLQQRPRHAAADHAQAHNAHANFARHGITRCGPQPT